MAYDNIETIKKYVDQNNFVAAKTLVLGLDNCEHVESVVHKALKIVNSNPEFLDFTLGCFLSTHENNKYVHDRWIHSLSHFTRGLWELELYEWVKKLNKVAFDGAIVLKNAYCIDRLLVDFITFHKYDAVPSDFYISDEITALMDWSNYRNPDKLKSELENSPFESQEALLRFRLACTLNSKQWVNEIQKDAISTSAFDSLLKELENAGVDISEFDSQKAELYGKRLQGLLELRGQVREQYIQALEDMILEAEKQLTALS
jgi:hypothetical protein